MDKHFLEFIGNCFISAAKGQKHVEDLEKWRSRGFEGFDDLPEMFKKFYGLERLKDKAPDYPETWENFIKDFKKLFSDYLSFFSTASFEEHLSLVNKYEALKKKADEQEKTIKRLQSRSGESLTGQEKIAENLQSLIDDQTDQFQKMMDSFGQFAKSSAKISASRRKNHD
jgi:polyhydroxyalkanoate synthesis regulator protein